MRWTLVASIRMLIVRQVVRNHLTGGPEFAIKSLNSIHSCGCDIMSDGHPRTSKKWVANAVKGKLVDKPTCRASEMMRDIRRDYGISIPYHQHIMQNFNDQCVGKYAAPFKKLLRKILQHIAYVVTEQEYQDAMMAMELNSADAKEWVLRNDIDHWSHALFLGQRSLNALRAQDVIGRSGVEKTISRVGPDASILVFRKMNTGQLLHMRNQQPGRLRAIMQHLLD
ncbi:hypothetical protein Taro_016913 [Colocasia esculenta]|uniref:Uncharacterized protein n=1 Tax=Colocasia esculenta TaxID=4460 RepID=A0A843URQ5_COLES|nr:hypothetical protein [Colocasia esculenta]